MSGGGSLLFPMVRMHEVKIIPLPSTTLPLLKLERLELVEAESLEKDFGEPRSSNVPRRSALASCTSQRTIPKTRELVEFGEPEELLKVRSVQKFVFHPSPGFNT